RPDYGQARDRAFALLPFRPPEHVVETLHSRRETLGVNYGTVQQSQIESFAPVVTRLHGR
ncbi:MAG TPA: hypothetical protein VFQ42_03500, partial [Mycobacterium sp.]|nr:hypothetical protein [Mycobacterium sp.]